MKAVKARLVPAAPLTGELRTTVATLAMQTIARRFVIFPWLVTFSAPGTHVVNGPWNIAATLTHLWAWRFACCLFLLFPATRSTNVPVGNVLADGPGL